MFVVCEIEKCVYNRDGCFCAKESISIQRKTFSGFVGGERETGAVCMDCEEMLYGEEDDGLFD